MMTFYCNVLMMFACLINDQLKRQIETYNFVQCNSKTRLQEDTLATHIQKYQFKYESPTFNNIKKITFYSVFSNNL